MLLSATKSRKKQQTELVQSVLMAEEEKRKRERQNCHITSVPIMFKASHEPSLYSGTADEPTDERKLAQDRNTKERSLISFKPWQDGHEMRFCYVK